MDLTCDYCGKPIRKSPCKVRPHNFCSRQCLWAFASREKNPDNYAALKSLSAVSIRMSKLNREMNPSRMTAETRKKISDARYGSGDRTQYRKKNGKHEHRIVAEMILGRKLKPGEVVHHVDGDKHNNSPENLIVFPSQAEHARFHNRARTGVIE